MNLQPVEILLILLLVLVIFGAKKIPELARGLGQGIKEFKTATRETREESAPPAKSEQDETE